MRTMEIAALPSLSPIMLRGGRGHDPLAGPKFRTFLLARMAIRRAVERLGLAGKVVLAPDYHHGVEIDALYAAGARLRFYRVDRTMRADLADAERQSEGASALYLTHFAGFPQALADAVQLCARRKLLLIEDCALAFLSQDGNRLLGSTGQAAIYCLYKTLPVPHGGALRMDDPGDEAPPPPTPVVLRHLAGSLLRAAQLHPAGHGARSAMESLRMVANSAAARFGVARVPVGRAEYDPALAEMSMAPAFRRMLSAIDLDQVVARRRRNYQVLQGRLGPAVTGEALAAGVSPLFFPLWVANKDRVLARVRARGIQAIDFWRRPHPSLEKPQGRDSEGLRDHVVELPCHQDLREEEMERVAMAAEQALV